MILDAQPDIEVVAEAGGGAAAVEAFHEHMPDIVLLDVRMPQIDGIEAARVSSPRPAPGRHADHLDQDDYIYDPSTRAPAASCSRMSAATTCSRPYG